MLLPGLEAQDEVQINPPEESEKSAFECSLTFESLVSFKGADFLRDMDKSNNQEGGERKRRRGQKCMQECIKDVPDSCNILTVSECGHKFLEIPFLYHVMTTEFRCPICRSGSSSTVDITATTARGVNPSLWKCLCMIAKKTRDRRKMEDAVEEMHSLMELQMQEIQSINRMSVGELLTEIQITVIFSVYSVAPQFQQSGRGVIPSASVTVGLRPNFTASFSADESFDEGSIPMV